MNLGGRPKKYSDADIEKLGKELLDCMNTDGVYHLTEFSEWKEMSPMWTYELAKDYPKFGVYLTRARKILGRKMLKMSMEENPDRWVIKTFLKRYISNEVEDVQQWVKDDIAEEAKAKAEAAKAANLNDIDPRVEKFLEILESKPSVKKDND